MKITAQVVLINQDGLVLGVSRKDDHFDMGLPGGKMEEQDEDDPMNTAIRETYEETGLLVSNLRLVFAIHKEGFMGYTYLAEYNGEINHNEPHVVQWLPMERLILGSFGKYNKMVADSLNDMKVEYVYDTFLGDLEAEIKEYVNKTPYDGVNLLYDKISKEKHWFSGEKEIVVYMKHSDDDYIDEQLSSGEDFQLGLLSIGKKYGFNVRIPTDYISK